jgi:CPA1 family monovalent cation:H+ antiporter
LRFAWIWASLRLKLIRRGVRVDAREHSEARTVWLTAFAGVRGAVTLAGVLTLPVTMADGSAFPARDLVIVLAMGVILVSLLLATAVLPLLSKGLEVERGLVKDEEA